MELYIQLGAVFLLIVFSLTVANSLLYCFCVYRKFTADTMDSVIEWNQSMRECIRFMDITLVSALVGFLHYYFISTLI